MGEIKRIEYVSEEGYKGVLFGKSILNIYSPDGKLILRTERSLITDPDELVMFVNKFPKYLEILEDDENG